MEEKITIDVIDYLGDLSKLQFTDAEKDVLLHQVTDIIYMLGGMNEIVLDENADSITQSLNDLRPDDIVEGMDAEDIFCATSLSHNGYFEVPKVVD